MTEISVGFTIVIPGSVDPGMHFGLEVKRLKIFNARMGTLEPHSSNTFGGLYLHYSATLAHHDATLK